jgi:hypothetical protein
MSTRAAHSSGTAQEHTGSPRSVKHISGKAGLLFGDQRLFDLVKQHAPTPARIKFK